MIQKLYNFLFINISFLYSNLSFYSENIFLKQKDHIGNKLNKYGYQKIKLKKNFKLNIEKKKIILVNKYFKRIVFSKKQIENIINIIFIKNKIAKKIESITGFKYNISFFLAYKTSSIPKSDSKKIWHANVWHKDKPYSKNTLKIILPIKEIKKKDGGIELLPKFNKDINNKSKIFKMIAKKNEFLIFKSNLCFHKAGNPTKNRDREQMLFQLNPSISWSCSDDLYFKQKKIEPKFPFFSDFFCNKRKINYKKI